MWLELERGRVPDGSATAKALDYSLKHWTALTRNLLDGDVPVDNNHLETFMGQSWKRVVGWAEEQGAPLPEGFRRRYLDWMFAAFETELRPVPGIAAALDAITLPNCVASSAWIEKMRFTLGQTGLWDRFKGRIFSATEVEHGKPAPDLFLHAAATMGWEPADCAVVEDSPAGVKAGCSRDDRVRLRGLDARRAAGGRARVRGHGRAAGAASAVVDASERLGDADGLVAALVLEGQLQRELRAALDRLDAHDLPFMRTLPPTGSAAGKRTLLSP